MLLDTSGLLSLVDRREMFHQLAVDSYEAATHRLTHSFVIAEFIALAHVRRLSRTITLDFVMELLADPGIETIWVDEATFREALNLLKARPDKTYSLCDAISFEIMRRRVINDSLATDRHFETRRLPTIAGRKRMSVTPS